MNKMIGWKQKKGTERNQEIWNIGLWIGVGNRDKDRNEKTIWLKDIVDSTITKIKTNTDNQ